MFDDPSTQIQLGQPVLFPPVRAGRDTPRFMMANFLERKTDLQIGFRCSDKTSSMRNILASCLLVIKPFFLAREGFMAACLRKAGLGNEDRGGDE